MCEIEAVSAIKKKGNNPLAAKMAEAAENKMAAYDQAKAKFMKEGLSAPEAGKAAQKAIDQMFGAAANSGGKTNNDKESFVDKSKHQNERVLGETNMKGELTTLIDASEDADNNGGDSSNNGGSRQKGDSIRMESKSLPKGKLTNENISLFGD